MMTKTPFILTREKHLDHMVKVVPFIVMGYAIQCYVLMQMSDLLGTTSVFILGASLIAMITGFITYDIKHQVTFYDDRFETRFFFFTKTVWYLDIRSVRVSEPKQTFANLRILTARHSMQFYFVDNADEIKQFLENHNQSDESGKQAA
jgi:hypothetical protein